MKVAFITTIKHNVGDDFVREGIKYLLKKTLPGQKIEFTNIHKHSPITSRYGFEFVRNLIWSERLDNRIPLWITPDRILSSDIVIQSGAPVYWYHSSRNHSGRNEWYKPLIIKRFLKKQNQKLFNIAAGSCQEYHSTGNEFFDNDEFLNYVKEFYSLCEITTVRDNMSKQFLNKLNFNAQLIPCSSIFAKDEYNIKTNGDDYVVLNYMESGGHYTFTQKISKEKWENTFKELYSRLVEKENVVCVCHNKTEVTLLKKLIPSAKYFYSNNYIDYLTFFSKAKLGITNRVHAAFILASFGKPAFIIGADSRALMSNQIGIESVFVEDANTELLFEKYLELANTKDQFKEKIDFIQKRAFNSYKLVWNEAFK